MACIINWIIGLIIGRGIAVALCYYLDYTNSRPGLSKQHGQWRLNKDKDKAQKTQSQARLKTIPTTLHAALYKPSLGRRNPLSELPPGSSPGLLTPSPSTEPQILMPNRHFLNVHSHYAKGPVPVVSELVEAPEIMQSYDYSDMNTRCGIGFQHHQPSCRTRRPARKINDLEKLPPLNSNVAAEINSRNKVLEQAAIFAKIRQKQEVCIEQQRRANRAPHQQLPPFVLQLGTWSKDRGSRAELSTPQVTSQITPSASPNSRRLQAPGHRPERSNLASDAPQRHVRWAPNLMQQKQKRLNFPQQPVHSPPIPIPRIRLSIISSA